MTSIKIVLSEERKKRIKKASIFFDLYGNQTKERFRRL